MFLDRCVRVACLLALSLSAPAWATELVYTPVNPSFGGNPTNASGLLSVAQAQNHTRAPVASPLQTFNDNLQRSILSRLSSEALSSLFGKDATLSPGTYQLAGYTITVTGVKGGDLTIVTTENSTGASASFTISSGNLSTDAIN